MEFAILNPESFDRFEKTQPEGSFYQSIEQYYHFKNLHTRQAQLFAVKEGENVLLSALVTIVKSRTGRVAEIMGGPVIDPTAENSRELLIFFFQSLKDCLKKKHVYYLRVIPNKSLRRIDDDGQVTELDQSSYMAIYRQLGFIYQSFDQVGYNFASPHYEYRKDIAGLDRKTLFASFSKAAQYSIKKTHEFGVTTRFIGYDELPKFHENTSKTAARLGFADKSLAYYESVFKTFKDNAKFVVAEIELNQYIGHFQQLIDQLQAQIDKLAAADAKRQNNHKANQIKELRSQMEQHGKRISQAKKIMAEKGHLINLAGALFFIQPQEVSYMFSYTNSEFKNFYGPYQVQEKILNLAVDAKIPGYNFYGVSGDRSGKDGVYEFKKGFNGYMVDDMGAFILPIKKIRYVFLQNLKKILRGK
ncbi:peptidoglycan bridge formation glycyltransferase FemA/FemB family protein [Oenococcus kitaharae]|uniref:Aminoacyltransferase FemA n=1 Tax=Oenococcus kitaharae DSM 17330 TaxID=1045004 RepID=G9WEW1_9LACO|nr:peptidoglycan bridge formation glycyltransferase FemA/FemB family protein [Oenococcus kitaharae]EHN58284.1 tRNA-dependent lipid II-Ala--L-alanine ligase [Oenococcus kitaharae DSM 17330]OEY81538.1 peptidoglycan interpeptide bridge formation protein [Oenococcus kitaharae]OEY83025.1 peptidoglycan interpeptide bridge formation protein [Oenococcus kitaharae]OEY84430.1 peptidoglycan interpeptide bridge formation protein [Oenococcus kitaharae]